MSLRPRKYAVVSPDVPISQLVLRMVASGPMYPLYLFPHSSIVVKRRSGRREICARGVN